MPGARPIARLKKGSTGAVRTILTHFFLIGAAATLALSTAAIAQPPDPASSQAQPSPAPPSVPMRRSIGINIRDLPDKPGPTIAHVFGDSASYGLLQTGDVVLQVKSARTATMRDLVAAVASMQADEAVPLLIERAGQRILVMAPLADHDRARISITIQAQCVGNGRAETRAELFEVWDPRGDEDPVTVQANRMARERACTLSAEHRAWLTSILQASRSSNSSFAETVRARLQPAASAATAQPDTVSAATPVTAAIHPAVQECRARASSPLDPPPGLQGVPFNQLDAVPAIAACERAVQAEPSAQNHYLLCRSLYRAERYSESAQHCSSAVRSPALEGHTPLALNLYNLLGLHLRYGRGVEQNYEVALLFFGEAGELSGSLYELGVMHHNGLGTPRSYQKAAEYWERAYRAGNLQAAFELAFLYRDGRGVGRDPRRAEQLWRAAAEADHPGAQVEVGLLAYQRQNLGDAREWWTRASAQGDLIAKRNLAVLIMQGPRQQRNEAEAFRLFLTAAEGGDPAAMRQVAICYATGMLVDRNLAEADRWTQRLIQTNDPNFVPWARQYQSDVRALRPMSMFLSRRTPWDESDREVERARGEAAQARSEAQQEIWRERHMNQHW